MNIYCPNCENECSEAAVACPKCGHPLAASAAPEPQITCPGCSAAISALAATCPGCGYPLAACPNCGAPCGGATTSCPQCGHPLEASDILLPGVVAEPSPSPLAQRVAQPPPFRERKWSPGVAALLSVVFPGAGQVYKNQLGAGAMWFVFTVIGYFVFFLPGFICHIICVCDASSGDPYK